MAPTTQDKQRGKRGTEELSYVWFRRVLRKWLRPLRTRTHTRVHLTTTTPVVHAAARQSNATEAQRARSTTQSTQKNGGRDLTALSEPPTHTADCRNGARTMKNPGRMVAQTGCPLCGEKGRQHSNVAAETPRGRTKRTMQIILSDLSDPAFCPRVLVASRDVTVTTLAFTVCVVPFPPRAHEARDPPRAGKPGNTPCPTTKARTVPTRTQHASREKEQSTTPHTSQHKRSTHT